MQVSVKTDACIYTLIKGGKLKYNSDIRKNGTDNSVVKTDQKRLNKEPLIQQVKNTLFAFGEYEKIGLITRCLLN